MTAASLPRGGCACGCPEVGHIMTFTPSGPQRGRCRDLDCGCDEYAPGETGYLPAPNPDLVDPPCTCGCRRSQHQAARGTGRLTATPDWDVSCSNCACRKFRTPGEAAPPPAPKKRLPVTTVAPPSLTPELRRRLVAGARTGNWKRSPAAVDGRLFRAARAYAHDGRRMVEVTETFDVAESNVRLAVTILRGAPELIEEVEAGRIFLRLAVAVARARLRAAAVAR